MAPPLLPVDLHQHPIPFLLRFTLSHHPFLHPPSTASLSTRPPTVEAFPSLETSPSHPHRPSSPPPPNSSYSHQHPSLTSKKKKKSLFATSKSVQAAKFCVPKLLKNSPSGPMLPCKKSECFATYAEVCFARFGDRVKHWITLNEPLQTAINGYSCGAFAPGRHDNPYKEPYVAAHYQILAHAAAVDVYRKKFKATQGGEIGLVVDCEWAEAFSDKEQDKVAADRRLDFQLGWFLDPIFFGDYPAVMREKLGDHLPQFTQRDKELLRNAIDFVGLNHYTTKLIAHTSDTTHEPFYEVQEMKRIVKWQDGELIGERAASPWLYIVPWGFRKVLNYVAQKYKNPPVYVTENGMDDEENETATLNEFLDDQKRVKYFKDYLGAAAQAIRDGVDVRGYFAWSLLDNFEWSQGYTKRFGLVYVDYKNELTRYPKSSALWFSHFLKNKEDNDLGKK